MEIIQEKSSLPDALLREDFKHKLKSWFENKGINKKLETYLRSQMIVEFHNSCGTAINSTGGPSVSPRLQAIKLLVADFLVQEDLLFSLSVFVSEVPFLSNLPNYTHYVEKLAQPRFESMATKPNKPKFSDNHLFDLFEALKLDLSKEEILVLRTKYEASNCNSLLVSLLSMLPVLLKKYRNIERSLNKTRQKEKFYRKMVKSEKAKVKQMYTLLQEAYKLVQKHKNEIIEAVKKHDECNERLLAVEKQSTDLTRRENELLKRQQMLGSKEHASEQKYHNKLKEVEKKLKIFEEQDRELQNKYKLLQNDQTRLQIEREQFEAMKSQIQITNSREVQKLEEYERKLCNLQNQVLEIVRKCDEKEKLHADAVTNNREIQCTFDTSNRSQQTENDDFINIEQYLNLVEKENALLKLSSNKQRYRINQLTSEMLTLKNKLEYLENEMQIRKRVEHDEKVHRVAHKLYFPRSPRETTVDVQNAIKTAAASASAALRSRRRLAFDEQSHIQAFESSTGSPRSSSSNNFATTNHHTDEIVADAKTKLKELEAESEMLNQNLQNLQTVLARNVAFVDRPFAMSSSLSDSSPQHAKWRQYSRLTRSTSDLRNANATMSPTSGIAACMFDFGESSPSSRTDPEASPASPDRRDAKREPFSRIFYKYRKQNQTKGQSGSSDGDSLPSERKETSLLTKQSEEPARSGENTPSNSEVVLPIVSCENGDSLKPVVIAPPENAENENGGIVKTGPYNFSTATSINTNVNVIHESLAVHKATFPPKSTNESSDPSESTNRSNEIISAGPSNESNSSEFWK